MEDYAFLKGSELGDAQQMFKAVTEQMSIAKLETEKNEGLSVSMMNDVDGWLPAWMLKCEEFWALLTGSESSMWNADYQAQENSVCGIVVGDKEPRGEDREWPVSLRYLVAELSMREMLVINNDKVAIKDVEFYFNTTEDNRIEPLDVDSMVRLGFMRYMTRMRDAVIEMANEKRRRDHDLIKDKSDGLDADMEDLDTDFDPDVTGDLEMDMPDL